MKYSWNEVSGTVRTYCLTESIGPAQSDNGNDVKSLFNSLHAGLVTNFNIKGDSNPDDKNVLNERDL